MIIILQEYSRQFPRLYNEEKNRIVSIIQIKDIHHVGSTAVPGLSGKGTIDILIGLEKYECLEKLSKSIEKLGYVAKFINYEKEWTFLSRAEGKDNFHLHIIRKGSNDCEEWFLLRNYLRTHLDEAKIYAKLKKQWYTQSKGDSEEYTKLKTSYIQSVIAKARKSDI